VRFRPFFLIFSFCFGLAFKGHLNNREEYSKIGINDEMKRGEDVPRINRGETKRVSIRISKKAKTRIMSGAKNFNVSQAGMIMFALSNIFQKEVTKEQLLNLENKIVLEPENFAITMPGHLYEKVEDYTKQFEMKKNTFIGLLVSDYYEKLPQNNPITAQDQNEGEPKKLQVKINQLLKEKVFDYSENHYLSFSGLVTQAIENGHYEGLPEFSTSEKVSFMTAIPLHAWEKAQKGAAALGVPLHFYLESCLYKAFMTKSGIFYQENSVK
jgi:hypothetical protein